MKANGVTYRIIQKLTHVFPFRFGVIGCMLHQGSAFEYLRLNVRCTGIKVVNNCWSSNLAYRLQIQKGVCQSALYNLCYEFSLFLLIKINEMVLCM